MKYRQIGPFRTSAIAYGSMPLSIEGRPDREIAAMRKAPRPAKLSRRWGFRVALSPPTCDGCAGLRRVRHVDPFVQ